MRALLLLVLPACIDIASEHHCATDEDCGTNGRCEPSKNCSLRDATCGPDGFRYGERAGDRAGICVVATQLPTDQVMAVDLDAAGDHVTAGCGPAGASDAMFEIRSSDAQVIVFDTAGQGATAPALLSLHQGSCPPQGAPVGGLCATPSCTNAPAYSRLAVPVPAGSHCLVVEEAVPSDKTSVALRVLPAHRGFTEIQPGVRAGPFNSCTGQPNVTNLPCGMPNVPEAAFVIGTCPALPMQLSVMVEAAFPAIASIHDGVPQGQPLACANTPGPGPEALAQPVGGPGPYWILVEGVDPAPCGDFMITVGLAPL